MTVRGTRGTVRTCTAANGTDAGDTACAQNGIRSAIRPCISAAAADSGDAARPASGQRGGGRTKAFMNPVATGDVACAHTSRRAVACSWMRATASAAAATAMALTGRWSTSLTNACADSHCRCGRDHHRSNGSARCHAPQCVGQSSAAVCYCLSAAFTAGYGSQCDLRNGIRSSCRHQALSVCRWRISGRIALP